MAQPTPDTQTELERREAALAARGRTCPPAG